MRAVSFLLLFVCLFGCTSSAENNNRANALVRQSQYAEALRAIQLAQVAEPDNALYYFNAASAYLGVDDPQQALAVLEQAIMRGDTFIQSRAYFNMGNIYLRNADYDSAIFAYQQALLLDNELEPARFNLEIALQGLIQATPTPIEMNTRPDQQSADLSPTPNPSGQNPPTLTPTPLSLGDGTPIVGGEEGGLPGDATLAPQSDAQLNIEAARRVLDEFRQEAPGLGGLPVAPAPQPMTPTWKDW